MTSRSRATGGNPELYVMNADGSDLRRLTDSTGANTNADWSPKGDRIAFESTRDGNSEIYVMNADGSDPVRLTTFDRVDTKPTWSPTGDRIAFHRQVDKHLQVYTMNVDGTGDMPITFTATPHFSGFPSRGKWSAQQP
jgi:Tol biopolymer transport system component